MMIQGPASYSDTCWLSPTYKVRVTHAPESWRLPPSLVEEKGPISENSAITLPLGESNCTFRMW